MRRFLVAGTLLGFGVLVVRLYLSKVRERFMAHCEGMFERMPESFPPKKMMLGIEQLRVDTRTILKLLEARGVENDEGSAPSMTGTLHDVA